MGHWSDEEYGIVATALLYPAYRRAVVTYGYMLDGANLEYKLDARLRALPDAAKAEIIELSQQVKASEADLAKFGSGSEDNVKKVDKIEFFEIRDRRKNAVDSINRTRLRISALVDCPINPNSPLSPQSGGGVSGSCTG